MNNDEIFNSLPKLLDGFSWEREGDGGKCDFAMIVNDKKSTIAAYAVEGIKPDSEGFLMSVKKAVERNESIFHEHERL